MGLDGLEICYPGHTEDLEKKLQKLHNENRLIHITGGSDCHDKKHRPLGVSGISKENFYQLKNAIKG